MKDLLANPWLLAAIATMFALVPCGWMALTSGDLPKRLVALEMSGVIITLEFMLLTLAFGRMPLMDFAIALGLLSFGGGMVFAHFLARHL